jgi:hypothetical protein
VGKKAAKRRVRQVRLVVIPQPEPGTRTVINYQGEGTVIFRSPTGPATELLCGKCSAPLVVGMAVDQVRRIVLRCKRCGSFNEALVS